MDLFFNKQTNVYSDRSRFIQKSRKRATQSQNLPLLKSISIANTKLNICLSTYNANTIKKTLFFPNSFFLTHFNEYVKVLRKSMIPWVNALSVFKCLPANNFILEVIFLDLRQRMFFKNLSTYKVLYLNYTWSSRFYKVKRIKRWLSKKYTNILWR